VYSLNSLDLVQELSGHRKEVPYVATTPDGKFVLSCSPSETILWNSKTWENIAVFEERFTLCFSLHRLLKGILHDGHYKSWSNSLITEFFEDYKLEEDEEEPDQFEFLAKEIDSDDIHIVGPMNCLSPLIIKNMLQERKSCQVNFVHALSKIRIAPYNVNILHFMSYYNNPGGVSLALHLNTKYQRDKFKMTPLAYAMQRVSYDCT